MFRQDATAHIEQFDTPWGMEDVLALQEASDLLSQDPMLIVEALEEVETH